MNCNPKKVQFPRQERMPRALQASEGGSSNSERPITTEATPLFQPFSFLHVVPGRREPSILHIGHACGLKALASAYRRALEVCVNSQRNMWHGTIGFSHVHYTRQITMRESNTRPRSWAALSTRISGFGPRNEEGEKRHNVMKHYIYVIIHDPREPRWPSPPTIRVLTCSARA